MHPLDLGTCLNHNILKRALASQLGSNLQEPHLKCLDFEIRKGLKGGWIFCEPSPCPPLGQISNCPCFSLHPDLICHCPCYSPPHRPKLPLSMFPPLPSAKSAIVHVPPLPPAKSTIVHVSPSHPPPRQIRQRPCYPPPPTRAISTIFHITFPWPKLARLPLCVGTYDNFTTST